MLQRVALGFPCWIMREQQYAECLEQSLLLSFLRSVLPLETSDYCILIPPMWSSLWEGEIAHSLYIRKVRSKQTLVFKDVSTEDSGEQGGLSISHPHCSAQKYRRRIQAYSSHLSRNQLLSMATCFHYFCNYSTSSSKHITCTGDSKRSSLSFSP